MERVESLKQAPIDIILRPFRRFAQFEASGGMLLLICSAVALAWANSPWAAGYFDVWEHHKLTIGWDAFSLSKTPLHWINDGLMAVFFLVVGLEIKREMLVGELASVRRAALPMAAAVGGMVVPAGIYAALNAGTPGMAGWGIPMATDIAFALGVIALLGNRVPLGLKVFLAALAIVDDIGAVLVIAFFYTAEISVPSLALGGICLVILVVLNTLQARHPLWYIVPGVVLWFAVLKSGVHATIAGVLLAMTIPARRVLDLPLFLGRSRQTLDLLERALPDNDAIEHATIEALEELCEQAQTPLSRIEHALLPWVSFFIMPLFALANAGVAITAGMSLNQAVSLGIILGLLIGKPLGIFLFAWGAVKLGIAVLPVSVTWRQVFGAGLLGGIGFTMSLFIAGLAFSDPALLGFAKIGILTGSAICGIGGFGLLWLTGDKGGGNGGEA